MKLTLILLIALPFAVAAQQQSDFNSFKELDRTMAVFLDRLLVQRQDTNGLFIMTREEFQSLNKNEKPTEVEASYSRYADRMNKIFTTFETRRPYPVVRVTDTITSIKREGRLTFPVLNAYVLFSPDSIPYASYESPREQYVEFSFILIGDHLRLIDVVLQHSKPAVDQSRMYHAESEARRGITSPQLYRFWYEMNSFPKAALPFRKHGKWGFTAADNKLLFPAICDSVFPFQNGYTMVVIKGRYNLLDSNFVRFFGTEVKTILQGPFYFSSVNEGKLQPRSSFSENRSDIRPPESFRVGDAVTRNKTGYLFSEDGTNFRALKPYLEVDDFAGAADSRFQHNPFGNNGSTGGDGTPPKRQKQEVQAKWATPVSEQPAYTLTAHFVDETSDHVWTLLKNTRDTIGTFKGWSDVRLFKDVLYGTKSDSTYIMEPNGWIIFQTPLYCELSGTVLKIFDPSTGLFGAYLLDTKKSIPVRYRLLEKFRNGFRVITQDGQAGFLNARGEELFD